jgi:sugar/nucleoside kinase (ribokinase family)
MGKLDAICFGGTLPDSLVDRLCQQARQLGKPIFANPTRFQNPLARNLHGVRIVQVSRDDVSNFGLSHDVPAYEVAEVLLRLGCEVVVVTESERGQRAFDQGGNSVWMPSIPDRIPSFPTGTGDVSFMANAAGYLAGLSVYDWLNLGSVAGAFFVEHGYPGTKVELSALFATQFAASG